MPGEPSVSTTDHAACVGRRRFAKFPSFLRVLLAIAVGGLTPLGSPASPTPPAPPLGSPSSPTPPAPPLGPRSSPTPPAPPLGPRSDEATPPYQPASNGSTGESGNPPDLCAWLPAGPLKMV